MKKTKIIKGSDKTMADSAPRRNIFHEIIF